MAHRIEMEGGAYVVIDQATGRRAAGSSEYPQRHFAEEFVRLAKESSRPVDRARDSKGRMKADDPATPDVNEAYVGGKAPKKKAKKKAAPKKKAPKK